jgi:hypothetical protein
VGQAGQVERHGFPPESDDHGTLPHRHEHIKNIFARQWLILKFFITLFAAAKNPDTPWTVSLRREWH